MALFITNLYFRDLKTWKINKRVSLALITAGKWMTIHFVVEAVAGL